MPNRQMSSSPGKTGFVSLSDYFFTQALPRIQDVAELKVVLYACYLILRKPNHPAAGGHYEPAEKSHIGWGRPRFVTYQELKTEFDRLSAGWDEPTLRQALKLAVEHGVLLRSTVNIKGVEEEVYSLAAPLLQKRPPAANIFALYEQNIGIITPMIAEELKEAEKLYPPQWIEEAFKEAVTLNKRSWKYISRILERWASEGKDSGEYQRDVEKSGPDKYIKGKYGHLVKR